VVAVRDHFPSIVPTCAPAESPEIVKASAAGSGTRG
jgi:hypothetical protein